MALDWQRSSNWTPENWRRNMLEDLRGLWRIIQKYDKVFHSHVSEFQEHPPTEWYATMKRVAARIKSMPDDEVLQRCKVSKAVATLVREEFDMAPKNEFGAVGFNMFLDGLIWR